MLKFLRRKSSFQTIQAEDLQVGDRFVYALSPVVVLRVASDNYDTSVLYDRTANGVRLDMVSQMLIQRDLPITIVKR